MYDYSSFNESVLMQVNILSQNLQKSVGARIHFQARGGSYIPACNAHMRHILIGTCINVIMSGHKGYMGCGTCKCFTLSLCSFGVRDKAQVSRACLLSSCTSKRSHATISLVCNRTGNQRLPLVGQG